MGHGEHPATNHLLRRPESSHGPAGSNHISRHEMEYNGGSGGIELRQLRPPPEPVLSSPVPGELVRPGILKKTASEGGFRRDNGVDGGGGVVGGFVV